MIRLLSWKCQHLPVVLAEVLKMKFFFFCEGCDTLTPTPFHLDIHKAASDIFLYTSAGTMTFLGQESEIHRTTLPRSLTI